MTQIASSPRPWPAPERFAIRAPRVSNAALLKAVFLIPVASLAIFAVFLQPLAATSLCAGLALVAGLVLWGWAPGERLATPIDLRLYAACLATSLALCLLGGEYHLFYATWDWYTRDAILSDLVNNAYPVLYYYQGADFILRAPLGMYMAPAAVGWGLGLKAAHLALLLQNAFLFGGIFYLLACLTEGRKTHFLILFLLSGPIDAIPHLVECYLFQGADGFVIHPHFMFWNLMAWYWAQLPQLFWAPNHAFSGWMIGTLLLLHLRREIDVALLAMSSIVLLFWSPLPMIGAAPLLLMAGLRSLSLALLRWRTALAALAGVLLFPLLVYLSLDSATLSRGWLFQKQGFFTWYTLDLIFALPQMWLLLSARDATPQWLRPIFYASSAILVLFPLYRIGANDDNNDMTMRGMLTPMFLLGFIFVDVAPALVRGRQPRAGLTVAILSISALTGLMEISRAVSAPAYAINDCNFVTVMSKIVPGIAPTNYLARVESAPEWLAATQRRRLEIERRQCWPGFPLATEFDSTN